MHKITRTIILALACLSLAALGAAAAFADSGSGNPGSPGDNCSHGSSDTACKDDPSTNGKDCDDHGNARGNEDHCGPATTTNEETTSSTTSTNSTTTTTPDTTSSNSTTTTTSNSNPTTTTTPTTGTNTTPVVPPSTTPRSPSLPRPVFPLPTGGIANSGSVPRKATKQKIDNGAKIEDSVESAQGGSLPRTGVNVGLLFMLGIMLLSVGQGLRAYADSDGGGFDDWDDDEDEDDAAFLGLTKALMPRNPRRRRKNIAARLTKAAWL